MPAEFDDLSRRLADLESDVNRLHPAGPTAARRRGRQRTRNRAVAVAIGSACAVIIGIGALNALPLSTPSIPEPIDSPTPDQDTGPTPDADPPDTDTPEADPLTDLLLEPSDLADIGWPWVDLSWTEGIREPELDCFPAGPDDAETAGVAFQAARTVDQPGDFSVWADERIYSLASEADADAALTALRSQLGQCATDRDDVELTRTWEYDGIGEAAFQSEVLPPDDQLDAVRVAATIGAARTGSTLVVTVTYIYMQGEFVGQADLLAPAVSKVCGGDCVGEITQRQTYPDPAQADDQLLLNEEVNPIGSYTDFVRSDTRTDPGRYELFCIPSLVFESIPEQGGEAPAYYQAEWFGPSEGTFYETVIVFAEEDEAAGFVAEHTVLPEQCGDVSPTHEQVVNQPEPVQVSGADEALVWTTDDQPLAEDPGSEGSFHGVGMARSGNVIVVIGFAAFGDPTTGTSGTWTDYATETLALALDRAQS
jgi:hypothetical protein